MKHFQTILILSLILSSLANADLSVGDTFKFYARYESSSGMSSGYTTASEVVNSVSINGDTTTYGLSIKYRINGGGAELDWRDMKLLIQDTTTKLVIVNSIPSGVRTDSKALKSTKWVLSEQSTAIFYKSILPMSKFMPIPILDSMAYAQSVIDYTVRVSDTVGMKWSNNRIHKNMFYGELIRYSSMVDTVGNAYYAYDNTFEISDHIPYWISSQGINPLNLGGVHMSGELYPLNQNDLTMGEGFYGMYPLYSPYLKPSSSIIRKSAISTSQVRDKMLYYLPNGTSIRLDGSQFRLRIGIEGIYSTPR